MKDDVFTQQEFDDAASMLMQHIDDFCSDTNMGHHLRKDAIRAFKHSHNIKTNDEVMLHIEVDLANDIDVSNALILEEAYDRKACTRTY